MQVALVHKQVVSFIHILDEKEPQIDLMTFDSVFLLSVKVWKPDKCQPFVKWGAEILSCQPTCHMRVHTLVYI